MPSCEECCGELLGHGSAFWAWNVTLLAQCLDAFNDRSQIGVNLVLETLESRYFTMSPINNLTLLIVLPLLQELCVEFSHLF